MGSDPPIVCGRVDAPAWVVGRIAVMTSSTATPSAASSAPNDREVRQVSVLLYSDDITTRDAVRAAVGRRPARDVEVTDWRECATPAAVIEAVETAHFDLLVLDGEAVPAGGLGLCRQLKSEIYDCPPILVLTGRPQDAWLATWSFADHVVPHPLDAIALANGVADVVRGTARA